MSGLGTQPVRLIVFGRQGAGKGTQAVKLAERHGIPHISTGDIFRANLKEGTALGLEAKKYMEAGEYVPDSVTNGMVADRLSQSDAAGGFLLDGYPRTVDQVHALNAMLAESGLALDYVIEITANTEEVVARLLNRAKEQGRADDTEEVIRRRMEVYAEQTAPLTDLYEQQGVLRRVDGMGSVEAVSERILAVLQG